MGELMYINGAFMAPSEGKVSAEDRGYNFADGIYEVVRVYGGQPFTMREHLERLERSGAGLDMRLPHPIEGFEDLCSELIERSQLQAAILYLQVTRGVAPRNHLYADDLEPTVMAYVRPSAVRPAAWSAEGLGALPMPDNRWNMCHLKTIALLPNILAKNRAHRAGCIEALFTLEDGTVSEGSSSNAFAVRGGEIWTAPLSTKILPGITRMQVLALAKELGIRLHEQALPFAEFAAADEIIMSASNLELVPIVRLGDQRVGSGKPGPVFARLYEAYQARVNRLCSKSK